MRFGRRLVCAFLVGVLAFPAWAQSPTPAQMQQAEEYLKTPEGQRLLQEQQKPGATKPTDPDKETAAKKDADKTDAAKKPVEQPSDIERYFSETLERDSLDPIKQFGYETFKKPSALLSGSELAAIGGDYIVGPGDSLSITVWGISEGQYKVQVSPEGKIVLPKVGAVTVTGTRYGELATFIEKQLSRYYQDVNVDVSLDQARSIRIYVVGEVRAPGSYIVGPTTTAYGALFSAGGPTKKGTLRDVKVLRGGRAIGSIDLYQFLLRGNKGQDILLQPGDTVFVPLIGPVVGVAGNVARPGIYEMRGSTDLSDVLQTAGGALPTSYTNRIQIERVIAHEKKIVTDKTFRLDAKIPKLFVSILNMDLVKLFPIAPEIENTIFLDGSVKYAGAYELKPTMRIRDVIKSPAVLRTGAYLPRAEIVRTDPKDFKTEVIAVDLQALFQGDPSQNYLLVRGDRIRVFTDVRPAAKVTLVGEFKLPGEYTVRKGERLSSIIERAGGFTPEAYLFGAVFTRRSAAEVQDQATTRLVEEEEKQILTREKEIKSSLDEKEQREARLEALEQNKLLLAKLRQSLVIKGRVIVRLNDYEKFKGSPSDLELEDGDVLRVPHIPNTVSVIGEVFSPSSLIYEPGQRASYYLSRVGGPTKAADPGSVFIIRADGSTISREQGVNVNGVTLIPGDSVLVPSQIEKYDFWGSVRNSVRVLYEATLSVAIILAALK